MTNLISKAFSPQAVGVLRAATGLLFIARPAALARTWVDSDEVGPQVLTRSVGARDLAIGAGLMITGQPALLAASVVSDLVDGTEAVLGNVPARRRKSVAAWALGFAVYGIVASIVGRSRS